MPKKARELYALEVGRLRRPGFNLVGGVPGLGLQVVGDARSWLLRFSFAGRRPEMGLGGFPEVGLADARERAKAARSQLRQGINPIEAANADKSSTAAKRAASKTFKDCAAAFITAKAPEWANAKHAAQWTSTLATYADPVIGALLVQDVDTPHILQILEPIWLTKTETATRVRSRLEAVIAYGDKLANIERPNPARWAGHLSLMLAKPSKVHKVQHYAALPYAELPAFMARLREAQGQGARALEFAILTAARSGMVRGAKRAEIDSAVWTVPGIRMKGGEEHRVPLAKPALQLLKAQPAAEGTNLIFPGTTHRKLSDMTLTAALRRMGVAVTVHGFRASFKTWASERTNFPREVVEMALAHAMNNKVEEAYQRGDLFDKRARLMKAWSDFCTRASTAASVTPIRKEHAAR